MKCQTQTGLKVFTTILTQVYKTGDYTLEENRRCIEAANAYLLRFSVRQH